MKAEEARAKAFNSAIPELERIKEQIKNACEIRQMFISINDLSRAAMESLKADGYKIDKTEAPGYSVYTISW